MTISLALSKLLWTRFHSLMSSLMKPQTLFKSSSTQPLSQCSYLLSSECISNFVASLSPILKNLKDAMFEVSAGVIDDHSQRIVFNDPNASDPTHSMLAKDHFVSVVETRRQVIDETVGKHPQRSSWSFS